MVDAGPEAADPADQDAEVRRREDRHDLDHPGEDRHRVGHPSEVCLRPEVRLLEVFGQTRLQQQPG